MTVDDDDDRCPQCSGTGGRVARCPLCGGSGRDPDRTDIEDCAEVAAELYRETGEAGA